MHSKPYFRLSFLLPKYWLLWFGFALLRLLAFLPYSFLMRFGRILGIMLLPFAPARKKIIRRNLELCFAHYTPKQIDFIVRENFASIGMALFETALTWWASDAQKAQLGTVEGIEHLKAAQQQNCGILLLTAHFTTMEISAAILELQFSVHHTYRAHKNLVFDYMQHKMRQKHAKSALIERNDIKSVIKTLRQKNAVWYAPDQDYGAKHSLFVPFFGVPAATITATSRIAQISKAKVIPIVQSRLPNFKGYKIKILPPLPDFPSTNLEQDCIKINTWLEQIITANNAQYLWAHRRFKTRPKGNPSLY